MMLLQREDFAWINQVNDILSKHELLIEVRGNRIVSDYDIILSYFSSNITLLHAIPETKKILFGYLRILEKLSIVAKALFYELERLKHATIIKIEDKYYYLMDDNTILKEEDRRTLEEAYRNVMEAFRRIARAYIYTLLAGIETMMQQQPQQPMQPYLMYYYPYSEHVQGQSQSSEIQK